MRHFYFVRHGRTVFNEKEIVQGRCDSPLSENGRKQADRVGDMLSNVRFDYVFTGTQGRHIETAGRILTKNQSAVPTKPVQLPGLNEQSMGSFDYGDESVMYECASRLYESIHGMEKNTVDTKALMEDHKISMLELADIFHDMDKTMKTESVEDVKNRSISAMGHICKQTEMESNILIVSSGVILTILLSALTKEKAAGNVMKHGSYLKVNEENHKYFLTNT